MAASDEAITMFCSVTGADAHVAEHVLDAHSWDLDRSVAFYLENGAGQETASQPENARAGLTSSAIPMVEEPEDDVPVRLPDSPIAGGANDAAAGQVQVVDDEEEALRFLANQRASRRPDVDMQAPPGGIQRGFFDRPHGNRDVGRIRRNRPGAAAAGAAQDFDDLQAVGRRLGIQPVPAGLSGMPGPSSAAIDRSGDAAADAFQELPDMPAGINLEEARMLEAAMLGIPYEGHIPDYASAGPPIAPFLPGGQDSVVSPTLAAQRALREEQDAAFQASLLADQQKMEAEARQQREARDAASRQREAEAAAAAAERAQQAAAAEAQAAYERQLAAKAAGMPAEPAASEADAITVLVRLPDGRRLSRRFLRSNSLQSLFDFVDVQSAGGELRGNYSLVTQYPRRVLAPGPDSLAAAGLTQKQEAVFMETL